MATSAPQNTCFGAGKVETFIVPASLRLSQEQSLLASCTPGDASCNGELSAFLRPFGSHVLSHPRTIQVASSQFAMLLKPGCHLTEAAEAPSELPLPGPDTSPRASAVRVPMIDAAGLHPLLCLTITRCTTSLDYATVSCETGPFVEPVSQSVGAEGPENTFFFYVQT